MEQLYDYRTRLLAQLESAAQEIQATLEQAPHAQGGSPAHRALARLRNMEKLVYSIRLQKILSEEMPYMELFNISEWEEKNYDPAEPAPEILREYLALRTQELKLLRTLTPQQWTQLGRHSTFGVRTLQWWVERMLEHATRQLNEIRTA